MKYSLLVFLIVIYLVYISYSIGKQMVYYDLNECLYSVNVKNTEDLIRCVYEKNHVIKRGKK